MPSQGKPFPDNIASKYLERPSELWDGILEVTIKTGNSILQVHYVSDQDEQILYTVYQTYSNKNKQYPVLCLSSQTSIEIITWLISDQALSQGKWYWPEAKVPFG